VTLVGGGKYLFGSGSVRPYVGGGAGVISLRRSVTEARLGDVRDAVFNDFSVGEVDLSLAPASLTRPLVEAALGLGMASGRTYFDIGYRYRRAFRLANKLDFSQISVGVGYKF
jgi:opacity protein-like surface antigen